MDVLRLDTETFEPNSDVIEGYSTMIWTERFRESGDFQMKTPMIKEMRELIPEGSLITLRDSREVMIVETNSIKKNDDGSAESLIKGRTFETFLENRLLTGEYQTPWEMRQDYTVQDAILVIIWNSIINPTAVDVTHLAADAWPHQPSEENLPNVMVAANIEIISESRETVKDWITLQTWSLEMGEVYARVRDLLNLGNLGIRILRPNNIPTGTVVSVNSDGDIEKSDDTASTTDLKFEIYNGRNRSSVVSDVNPNTPVVFSYEAGDLADPEYLFSQQGFKNYARVVSSSDFVEVWGLDTTKFGGYTGETRPKPEVMDLRALYVDAGTISDDVDDPIAFMIQKGHAELKKANRIAILNAGISPLSQYKYKVDYDLGDTVSVAGDYGIKSPMVVSEVIRTEDDNGESEYPTLVVPDDI